MNIIGFFIFLLAIVFIGTVIFGAFTKKRSIIIAVIAAIVCLAAFGLSNYSWVESKSTGWAVGYGVFSLFSLGVALLHLIGKWKLLKNKAKS